MQGDVAYQRQSMAGIELGIEFVKPSSRLFVVKENVALHWCNRTMHKS
jgi:hypothetical protein